jgi:hypothetical protein
MGALAAPAVAAAPARRLPKRSCPAATDRMWLFQGTATGYNKAFASATDTYIRRLVNIRAPAGPAHAGWLQRCRRHGFCEWAITNSGVL